MWPVWSEQRGGLVHRSGTDAVVSLNPVANVFGNFTLHDVLCVTRPVPRMRALRSVWECISPRALDVVNNPQTNNLFWESISLSLFRACNAPLQ